FARAKEAFRQDAEMDRLEACAPCEAAMCADCGFSRLRDTVFHRARENSASAPQKLWNCTVDSLMSVDFGAAQACCSASWMMQERMREQMLELNEEETVTPELLDSQVQKAQEQLLALKRQQEHIEKQKRELEELSRRQEELDHGRAEMTDKLTRSLVILEREAYETQKKLEQLRATRESFGQHLEMLEAIDPKSWNPADLHKE